MKNTSILLNIYLILKILYFLAPTCYAPGVSFTQSYLSSSPNKIFRSNLFSVSSIIYFYCSNVTFTSTNTWTLNQVDAALKVLKAVDLSTNPTSGSTELVIKENTLDYGLYQFTLQVDVSFNGQVVSSQAQTYVEIIPTGLAVFALENGVSRVLVGSKQAFNLNPSLYTFDMDGLITPDKLSFVYYCKMVNLTDQSRVVNMQYDLKTFQTNANLAILRDQNCFGATSKKIITIFYLLE